MPVDSSVKTAYALHKRRAAKRGIEFRLSLAEWWQLWEPFWEQRGNRSLEMCMCRKYDEGAYELGNVRIATNKENHHERAMMDRVRRTPKKFRSQREYRTPIDKGSTGWLNGSYK